MATDSVRLGLRDHGASAFKYRLTRLRRDILFLKNTIRAINKGPGVRRLREGEFARVAGREISGGGATRNEKGGIRALLTASH
jgi:hypothetical protein